MTKDNILELDKIEEYRENNMLEAKAAQGGIPDTLWDSYSAFANTDGGCILLGVKEREDHSLYVAGLKDAEKMKKDFWNMVNNRQKVSVNLMTERRVRIESVEGRTVWKTRCFCVVLGQRLWVMMAMLELYDNPEELTFPEEEMSYNVEMNNKGVDKVAIKQMIVDKMAIMRGKDAEKLAAIIQAGDKMAINDGIIDKMADIVIYLETHPQSTSSAIAKLIDLQISSAKNYLKRLIELGFIVAHGANKNRTYSKK